MYEVAKVPPDTRLSDDYVHRDMCLRIRFNNDNNIILTLRESHHEHHVNGNEPQQVSHHHPIDHHHERADGFETPAGREKCVKRTPVLCVVSV